jgi:m7GpppX diphosphatase
MQFTIDDINYKFIPSNIKKNIESIKKDKLIFKNDVYEKYHATAEVEGELLICNDISKIPRFCEKIQRETYSDYLKYIEKRPIEIDRWVYNIIDGISEQESILYKDGYCIVIPTYEWDGKNIEKMHLLAIPLDTSLRCIRSLTSEHINLLRHMKNVTLYIIKEKYKIRKEHIKMYFHYEPSTYHLHIHFVHLSNDAVHSSVEYSHDLNNVIFNLSICHDYYQRAVLSKRG